MNSECNCFYKSKSLPSYEYFNKLLIGEFVCKTPIRHPFVTSRSPHPPSPHDFYCMYIVQWRTPPPLEISTLHSLMGWSKSIFYHSIPTFVIMKTYKYTTLPLLLTFLKGPFPPPPSYLSLYCSIKIHPSLQVYLYLLQFVAAVYRHAMRPIPIGPG